MWWGRAKHYITIVRSPHIVMIPTKQFNSKYFHQLYIPLKMILLKSAVVACLTALAIGEPIADDPDSVKIAPTCIPTSGGPSSVDDVTAIQSAIKACPSGNIVIPKGKTYHINSQLSFAGCSGCTLQVDGELSVSTDFTYWNGKGQIIHLQNLNGATITGSGTINGNGQASCKLSISFICRTLSNSRPWL